jgi:ATP-dependent DNA helicase
MVPTHTYIQENQLDFLLNKAAEYSQFIARDLTELQASLAESAQKALAKAEKKKRKLERKNQAANKKQKTTTGTETLDKEIAKDKEKRKGYEKAIFIQPPNLAQGCTLKDYQLEGVRWLASLYENGVSGILADEMGLGKTIQCVALIAHLLTKNVMGPYLVVAPLATLPNWVREFQKWLPNHPVVRYHGPAPEREALIKGPLHYKNRRNKDFPFIVTSYEVAIRDQAKLEKLTELTYLIVDEGHRLKNHRCTLLSSLKRLKAANRLLLTGTPIQNTLSELWSLLNFVNPTIFDDLSVFQSWFGFKDIGQKVAGATTEEDVLMEERKNQTVTKLHEILRPFLLRRIKIDVLSEMPPKKEVIVYSGISKLQAGYAELIEQGTLREALLSQGIDDGRRLSQTNKMMNHRKNVNHPFLFGEPIDPATGMHMGTAYPQLLVRASGKFALLDRMLTRLHADGHQVLIFSQMTSVLNVMEDYLNFRKWKYCRIDGSTNIDERQKQMDEFNAEMSKGIDGSRNKADDRNFVFLLSTRAGGLGINLTSADTCIIFDSDWNPHADSQAMDRYVFEKRKLGMK